MDGPSQASRPERSCNDWPSRTSPGGRIILLAAERAFAATALACTSLRFLADVIVVLGGVAF